MMSKEVLYLDLDVHAETLSVAITLFGPTSPAALATVVGVLVEVPVMLSVCRMCNASRGWYQRGIAA